MTVGIFAVLFGLVGAYALRAALVGDAPPPPPAPRTTEVPLAARDLPAGREIQEGDIKLLVMSQADMEARNLPLEQTMLSPAQIIGRVILEPIAEGGAFLTTNMFLEGTGPKLSDKLKPGMRAITVPINNLAAVGGSTVEGSFVDVLFKSRARPANMATGRPEIPETTITLLENVEVLSVGRSAPAPTTGTEGLDVRQTNGRNQGPTGIVSVTIAVTPDQANVVKAVLGQGDMSLALRSSAADGASTPNKYTLEGVLGLSARTHAMNRIDIFRGGWGRQTTYYQDDKLVKNDVSIIPGVAPTTPFPVPAVVPAAPKESQNSDPATRPTPNFYQGNGAGYGGVGGWGGWGGWGWGGWGGGAWGASGTGATYGDSL
jgi:pilus assembly protein CpaB